MCKEQPQLDIQNLYLHTRESGRFGKTCILSGISLSVEKGECVFLWGGNGAGKSSLLNAVAFGEQCHHANDYGIMRSTYGFQVEGKILLDGMQLTSLPPHKRSLKIARVAQKPLEMFSQALSLEENLALYAMKSCRISSFFKLLTKNDRDVLKDKLNFSGLDFAVPRLGDSITSFSGGELQQLAFFAATLQVPSILLLDEYTRDLDRKNRTRLEELTATYLSEHSVSVLWVSHDPKQVQKFCDRVVFMRGGKLVGGYARGKERDISIKMLNEFITKKIDNDG